MKRLKQCINKFNKKTALLVIILTVLTMTPLLFQGIICNDELQTRFLRKMGLLALIKDNINTATAKGRTIGGFVDVREFSFLTNNMYINRFVDIVLILMAIGLFMYFIYCINGNKAFSWFVGLMLMVCLPVTFEHGAPNAFVAITVIPAMFVIGSLVLYWKYLNTKKKLYLVLSMMLYLIAMMQYEFIVTYVLLFYALILKHECIDGKVNWLGAIKKAIIPTLVTLGYIVAYFVMQQFNTSNYEGNTIGFESLKSSLKILYVLAKSSIPGYFLFNKKYQYIEQVCTNQFEYTEFLKILLFLVVILFVSLIVIIFKKNRDKAKKWNWLEMLVAAAFMVIPSLPNSISSMYQGNVTESFFTWLPVSIFLYFAATFLLCSFVWNILKIMNKFIVIIAAVILACFVGQIQSMNYLIANQQHVDFERLQNIENMFDMQLWMQFDGAEIYSEDIYETRNLLSVHDKFWTTYLQNNGLDIDVIMGKSETLNLYMQDDVYFVLTNGQIAIVLSPEMMNGYKTVRISSNRYVSVKFKDGIGDAGYYIYSFCADGEKIIEIPIENAITSLKAGH